MPTTRQRHLLTETDEVSAAIDAAAPMYPGESRADILRHLVQLGADHIKQRTSQRHRMVGEVAGRHPGLYPAGYLEDLRQDWPE